MRPSGSVVTVGYQRARAMSVPRNQVRVVGLKMCVSFVPSLASMWPPATNSRPSGSVTCPAQNRLRPVGTGLNVPWPDPRSRSELSAASKPSQTTILPLESVAMWTGTSGHV